MGKCKWCIGHCAVHKGNLTNVFGNVLVSLIKGDMYYKKHILKFKKNINKKKIGILIVRN